ncbi:MAG: CehA/McbA family metallohydrolase [Chloroflexi bacterium]|nr:CehA/McbA family metallohydrolase [Chloroflexota bacterium]
MSIPIGMHATDVLVAHLAVGPLAGEEIEVGRPLAEYRFTSADGVITNVPVRERFEVGTLPLPWGHYPFLCVPDGYDVLESRLAGPWERIGFRRTEVSKHPPRWWWLWAWTNPRPDVPLRSMEVLPLSDRLVVGGVTIGTLGEHPLTPRPGRRIRIVLPDPVLATDPPRLTVDRGLATWPRPVPDEPDRRMADGTPGWGAPPVHETRAWTLAIAAVPSARVVLEHPSMTRSAVTWGSVGTAGQDPGAPSIEVVDPGRNWVRVTVTDESTGRPMPCRIAFLSPDGDGWAPHGHHSQVFSGLPDWNGDIGGDVRMGSITYAAIDGRCEGWLPRGEVIVDAACGFEVEPLRTRVTIEPGQTELRLTMRRWSDLAADGWYSGDTHVHFLSPQGALTEAAAEDLAVVNLLQAQWGHLFTNTEDFTGGPLVSADGRRIVWVGQENRQHILGHLNLLGIREPVSPWSTGGPGEAEVGGAVETTLARWADAAHAQGASVILSHFPTPNGEAAALVATGRADAVEMFDQLDFEHAEYYRYLSAGYRLPLVAGTDKMSSGIPVGLYRTFARLEDSEPLSFDAWMSAIKRGRTFISSGPLLRFAVDGRHIGDTLDVPVGATVDVEGEVASVFPVHVLQLVERGRVIDEVTDRAGARSLRLRARVRVEGPSWLALRAGGPGYRPIRHHDERRRGIMAHTGPVYLAPGGRYGLRDPRTDQYLLTLIGGSVEYLRSAAAHDEPGHVTHAHGRTDHQAWLEEPFLEAIEAIERRGTGR